MIVTLGITHGPAQTRKVKASEWIRDILNIERERNILLRIHIPLCLCTMINYARNSKL